MRIQKILIILLLLFSLLSYSQLEKTNYSTVVQEILAKKNNFAKLYDNSDSAGKDSIIINARKYLLGRITDEIFPYWYGTKWDFNGTTRIPKQGKIACGYFITNVLVDVGFNIPRVRWAQSASEVFIRKLTPNNIKRFSNKPISEVESYLIKTGDGLYLVG